MTSVTPDDQTVLAAAMLIALLAREGANVAAMVPVETGVDEPCEPGSRGALVRWAAGHLDDPRLVTPFALEADRATMHAADASGTLLHAAAFDRAREELCDGRTTLVVSDAIGLLDPITPSLTMLELIARWSLAAVIVEPLSRWSIAHVRLLSSSLLARNISIAGVILSPNTTDCEISDDAITAMVETLTATLDCPVLLLPTVMSAHDRGELLTAATACAMHRLTRRAAH
ncbi:MAG: dethiobiotin synthase [Gemmatimonadaceae bacterium]|nr:dethiobiotin synthase [Gemmatimonadaceae bacterium]